LQYEKFSVANCGTVRRSGRRGRSLAVFPAFESEAGIPAIPFHSTRDAAAAAAAATQRHLLQVWPLQQSALPSRSAHRASRCFC